MPARFKMVGFLRMYSEAITLQIEAVQSQVDGSMINVMQALQELSASTEARKAEADRVLETTYLAPDAQTSLMVESIQKSADDIFEQAQNDMSLMPKDSASKKPGDMSDDVRRLGGLFSKHMESMSTLDDSVRDLLLKMTGSLSNADVIKQRLDHVVEILRVMNLGLGNVLVDLESRLNHDVVSSFRDQLLDFTYKSYSVEEERVAFKRIFGPPPALQKAFERKSS